MRLSTRLIALGVAGAFSIGAAAPSFAAPVMTSTAAVKAAAPDHVTDVRWRGRGRGIGPGLAFGLAAGALVGATVAARPYGPDYYAAGPSYYAGPYDGPVYAQPYADAPTYVEPGYYPGYGRRCFTDEGYGRHRPCDAN